MTESRKQEKHSRHEHVFVILRIDMPVDGSHPENSLSVPKIFRDQRVAEEEAARLNELNGEKGCRYLCQVSRLVSDD